MTLFEPIGRRTIVWSLAVGVLVLTTGVLLFETGIEGSVVSFNYAEVGGGSSEVVVESESVFDGHGGAEYVIGMTLIASMGAAVVTRFGNHFGALLTLAVFTDVLGAVFTAYAYRAFLLDELPGGAVAALVASVIVVAFLAVIVPTAIIHFPTGKLRTPRWRWVVRLGVFVSVLLVGLSLTQPVLLNLAPNPIAPSWSQETADSAFGIGWLAWTAVLVFAATSLVWRLVDGVQWLRKRRRDRLAATTTPNVDNVGSEQRAP